MLARIYKPAKTTMQSGQARARDWILEYAPASARRPDPLKGWTATDDMNGEVRMSFESKDEAVAYAQRNGIPFELYEPTERKVVIKAYADNFAYTRKLPWTH